MNAEATPKPWAENVHPTPEQLADWLKVCTDEERLTVAVLALRNGDIAHRCFVHEWHGAMTRDLAATLAEPLCREICALLGEPRVLVPGEVSALITRALNAAPPTDHAAAPTSERGA